MSDNNQWVEAGALADIPRSGARPLNTSGGVIAVFRTCDDQVFATGNKCPHRGGPLAQGMVYGQRVQCAMHGLNIDLAAGKAVAPDVGCVETYPVKVENGRIWVNLVPVAASSCACAA
ncbi:MAG: nitrite reductase small subunit NirD [Betaproteobacteria bacterium]|nr:nitrite reductase small subunit NirD [Betaproteobacteria bacterium]